jgi:alkylhydroperoxidase family enzyme
VHLRDGVGLAAGELTVAPAAITDDDVAQLRQVYTDSQTAEIVYRACSAAFFNRVTEACGLPLEEESFTRRRTLWPA